jgi:hypothetical protein
MSTTDHFYIQRQPFSFQKEKEKTPLTWGIFEVHANADWQNRNLHKSMNCEEVRPG